MQFTLAIADDFLAGASVAIRTLAHLEHTMGHIVQVVYVLLSTG